MLKKTVNAILDSGNHYVLQVKANQPKLFEAIIQSTLQEKPTDTYQIQEKAHGRNTTWLVSIYQPNQAINQLGWRALNTLICIRKTIQQKEKNTKQITKSQSVSYRISDLIDLTAQKFAQGIRQHWGIENRIHWVKDVNFKEDNNGIKDETSAVIMALFNTIALNFLRQNIDDSIKNAQIKFGQNLKELFNSIRT